MGRFAIHSYRPKPGQEPHLDALVRKHLETLRAAGLVSGQACVVPTSSGAVVEMFEWCSSDAPSRARTDPGVNALWDQFVAVCEHTPLLERSGTQ